MLQIFQSLGRLSIRGYLVIAGLVAITILLNYSSWQSQLQIAARQAQERASERAHSKPLPVKETDAAAKPSTETDTTSAAAANQNAPGSKQSNLPVSPSAAASGAVQSAHTINGGTLVFSPINITLSLGEDLPRVSVSAPDGSPITAPISIGDMSQLSLKPKSGSSDAKTSWTMQPSGNPAPGIYKLQVRATAVRGIDTIEYTGTMTVVVLL